MNAGPEANAEAMNRGPRMAEFQNDFPESPANKNAVTVWMLTAQTIDAETALRWGLISEVTPPEKLQALVDEASIKPVYRVPTKPTRASKQRRLESKTRRSAVKSGRGRPSLGD